LSQFKIQFEPDTQSLNNTAKEFEKYSEMTGLNDSLIAVLGLLYDMEEKPADPLEYLY